MSDAGFRVHDLKECKIGHCACFFLNRVDKSGMFINMILGPSKTVILHAPKFKENNNI